MEENYISKYEKTHFYVNIVNRIYGVCINIDDTDKAEQIIAYFKKDRKKQIEAWKKEWEQEDFEKNQVCV